MKKITEFLHLKGFLFSVFNKIEPKQLNSRKKIQIFSGCDIKNHFLSIFIVNQESRFIMKNVEELVSLQEKLKVLEEHNFRKNILIISGEICSKSKTFLEKNNWIVYNDFV